MMMMIITINNKETFYAQNTIFPVKFYDMQ